MEPASLRTDLWTSATLEAGGFEGWLSGCWRPQTATGVALPRLIRPCKPLSLPAAPSHRIRHRLLSLLLIPLLALRGEAVAGWLGVETLSLPPGQLIPVPTGAHGDAPLH